MKQLYYDVNKCLGCKSCEIACSVTHSATQNLFSAIKEEILSLPRKKVFLLGGKNYPVSCRHCEDPKCVDACMAAALVYDKEKGMVLHNQERCVGCWMCVMACPYSAIMQHQVNKSCIDYRDFKKITVIYPMINNLWNLPFNLWNHTFI